MINQLLAFPVIDDCRLGDKSVRLLTEDDLEAFIKHLASLGRAASTRNHYVQLIKAMSKWAVRKGYRGTPLIAEDSDVVRRKKEAQRNRRLEPDEEESSCCVQPNRIFGRSSSRHWRAAVAKESS